MVYEDSDSADIGEEQRDELRTVLADRRRRFVLDDLLGRFQPVPVYDLADRMVAWEGSSDGDPTFEEVSRQLDETHLPRLEEAGLVESTSDGERYTLTEAGMRVEADVRGLDLDALAEVPGQPTTR